MFISGWFIIGVLFFVSLLFVVGFFWQSKDKDYAGQKKVERDQEDFGSSPKE